MRSEFLSFSPPALSQLEIDEVVDVLRKDWLSSGPKTKTFEEKFREKVGAQAALALNSCTAGLHLAMVVHGVDENSEVITTPMTFSASANVVEHQRGKVVLADIDPETLLIDPREIEKKMTKKTKMICPVHYAGHPCDMDKINALARSHGAVVVEDAAHCMPSKIGDKWVGSSDNLTAFSFYATKNITTGEGGMLTGKTELVDEARVMALHGMSRDAWKRFQKGGSWKYDVAHPGYKYNLPEMSSALGLVQLSRLDELYAKRMKVVELYEKAFKGSEYIVPLKTRTGFTSSHHLYVIQLNLDMFKINRDQFIDQMTERNIGTSVHYIPVHLMSYYAKKYGWKPESFPNAFRAYERMLSLPLSSRMSLADAADVVEAVQDLREIQTMKRLSDILFSLAGLLILSPLFAVIAVLVKTYDGGPVFFRQVRVGKGAYPFRMLKFRSMVVNADTGAPLTVGQDSRITPVGKFIRRYKIDELPQLWNVLRGEMSLVGPRPEITKFVDAYSLAQKEVLRLKPGITDPASFAFYDESELLATKADPERYYRDHLMGEKIRINLDYAAKASFATDLLLIVATVGRMAGVKLDIFGHLKIEMPR